MGALKKFRIFILQKIPWKELAKAVVVLAGSMVRATQTGWLSFWNTGI